MYVPVASAVAARQDGAQDLLVASAVLPGWGFPPDPGISRLFWGILFVSREF